MAEQLGEAAFDCAEGDAFAGLEDVEGDSFGVLLAHNASSCLIWLGPQWVRSSFGGTQPTL